MKMVRKVEKLTSPFNSQLHPLYKHIRAEYIPNVKFYACFYFFFDLTHNENYPILYFIVL